MVHCPATGPTSNESKIARALKSKVLGVVKRR